MLHYTGMRSGSEAIARLCDPAAKVSAHYVVEEDGREHALVDEAQNAWHAGVSYWRGRRNVNPVSIGVEIVNPGHEWGYRAFPEVQMEAVAKLCQGILTRHAIPARNVVAHSDIAPARKEDPGELFDWKWLAGQGVGLWPELVRGHAEELYRDDLAGEVARSATGGSVPPIKELQSKLAEYGYEVPQSGAFDEATCKVATAFQRHFRQKNISGQWDSECQALLQALLDSGT